VEGAKKPANISECRLFYRIAANQSQQRTRRLAAVFRVRCKGYLDD
jgi:hypothetical protein